MKKIVVLMVLLAAGLGSLTAFETTKTLDLSTQGVKRLEIEAGAGSLTVTGRDGTDGHRSQGGNRRPARPGRGHGRHS